MTTKWCRATKERKKARKEFKGLTERGVQVLFTAFHSITAYTFNLFPQLQQQQQQKTMFSNVLSSIHFVVSSFCFQPSVFHFTWHSSLSSSSSASSARLIK